jgi:hypothetical protein
MRTECAFCPCEATTGEHLWSDWLNKLLGPKKKYLMTERVQGEVRKYGSVGLHKKAPVLCDDCNSIWGSQIETKTKLIIADMACNGTPALLSKTDVTTIAIFSLMKSFVGDYMHGELPSFHDRRARFAFRNNFTFPITSQVWLARTSEHHGIFKVTYSRLAQNIPNRFEFYVFTVSMGQLVIQVVSSRWAKKSARRYADPPFLTQGTFWDAFSIPVLPCEVFPVYWPPAKQLDRTLLNEFVYRWEKINRAA